MFERIKSFTNYNLEPTLKKHICLHTTGSNNARGTIDWWKTRHNGNGTISTPYLIDINGIIYQLYNPTYWSHHTGLGDKDKEIIGIEIVNAGVLNMTEGSYELKNDIGVKSKNYMSDINILGEQVYHESFSSQQLKSIAILINTLTNIFMIDDKMLTYKENNEPFNYGIFSHQHINDSKSDIPDWVLERIQNAWRKMGIR